MIFDIFCRSGHFPRKGMVWLSLTIGLGIPTTYDGHTFAQVIPDGTLSTTVTTTDNQNFVIEDGDVCCTRAGQRTGNNLFHSFEEFSVPNRGSAQFEHGPNITNIFGRVTGEQRSIINGLVSVQGSANLFLINPQGITFGPNAELKLEGSFFASTAEQIMFEDGTVFSAEAIPPTPLLTISAPTGIQMGAAPQSIIYRSPSSPQTPPAGLTIQPNRTIGLVGSPLIINGGHITAPNSRVELGGIGANEQVLLNMMPTGYELDYDSVTEFADVTLTNYASIKTNGAASGAIQVQGDRVRLTDHTRIEAFTLGEASGRPIALNGRTIKIDNLSSIVSLTIGEGAGAAISLNADNTISLIGTGYKRLIEGILEAIMTGSPPLDDPGTGLLSVTGSEGTAGDIQLETPALTLRNGSYISSGTSSKGRAGNIRLNIPDQIDAQSTLIGTLSGSNAEGDSGNLVFRTRQLWLRDGQQISTSTFGEGNAGNIDITATNIVLSDQRSDLLLPPSDDSFQDVLVLTSMNSATLGAGAGGDITLNTETLLLENGSTILTQSSSDFTQETKNGGNINIVASGQIELMGQAADRRFSSFITTATETFAPAGNLSIETGRLVLRDGSGLSSESSSRGNAGNIFISASDAVELSGTAFNALIGTEAPTTLSVAAGTPQNETEIPTGQAGALHLTTPFLSIQEGATINVSNAGPGDAGDLDIMADTISIENQGLMTASTQSGDGGNINIDARSLLSLRRNSQILAQAGGRGNGGNITISSPFIVAVTAENSDIVANAFEGRGGAIQIETQGLFGLEFRDRLTLSSDITVSSELGIDGTVEINTPDADPNSQTLELPDVLVDISQLVRPGCSLDEDQFVLAGRGGLPSTPTELMDGDRPWFDLRDLSAFLNNPSGTLTSNPVESPLEITPLQEATGMAIAPNGALQLVAVHPQHAAIPHASCISQSDIS